MSELAVKTGPSNYRVCISFDRVVNNRHGRGCDHTSLPPVANC